MIFSIITIYAWKLVLLFLAVFAAGAIAGSVITKGFYALEDDDKES